MLFSVSDHLTGQITYRFDENIILPFPISTEEWGILWYRTDLKRVLIKIICQGERGFQISLSLKSQIQRISQLILGDCFEEWKIDYKLVDIRFDEIL